MPERLKGDYWLVGGNIGPELIGVYLKPKRYEQGEAIRSLDEFAKQEFIYYGDKLYHRGWTHSWQFSMVENALHSGHIRYASLIGQSPPEPMSPEDFQNMIFCNG